MKRSTLVVILILISVTIFSISFWLNQRDDFFAKDTAYKYLLQAKHITEKGVPDYNNKEMVDARSSFFPPLFEYLLAFFILLFGEILGPVLLDSLALASLPMLIYALSRKLQKNKTVAILSGVLGGFVPILWLSSINSAGKLPFILILVILTTIHYLNALKNKKAAVYFYLFFVLLCATTPAAAILVVGMFLNLILKYIEKKDINPVERELFSFAAAFYLFSVLIAFNTLFFDLGRKILWLNIPSKAQEIFYSDFNLIEISYGLGIFPMAYGIWIIYSTIAHSREIKKQHFTTAIILSTLLLLWLRILPWQLGVSLLGVFFAAQFAVFLNHLKFSIKRSKVARFHKFIYSGLVVLFILSSLLPAISFGLNSSKNKELKEIKEGLNFIEKKTPENARIVVDFNKAYATSFYTNRKVFLTTSFIAIKDPKERLEEYDKIYSSHFETNAREILDKYDLSYIAINPEIEKVYGIKELHYAEESPFIKKVYEDKYVKIYHYERSIEQRK